MWNTISPTEECYEVFVLDKLLNYKAFVLGSECLILFVIWFPRL